MDMLPKDFLNKQTKEEIRDVLNYLHGYLSSFQNIELDFEDKAGSEKGQKVNYKLNDITIIAIWVRKRIKPPFRCDVVDKTKSISFEGLHERGEQWEKGWWRCLEFSTSDIELRKARNLFRECIEINS